MVDRASPLNSLCWHQVWIIVDISSQFCWVWSSGQDSATLSKTCKFWLRSSSLPHLSPWISLFYFRLNCIITPGVWVICKLTPWGFLIGEIDPSKYFFFVNFANKICHIHCTWVYNNEFFYYKVVICNVCGKFFLAKSTKNVLRGVNFTNLKTLGDYIAKSKSQWVYL